MESSAWLVSYIVICLEVLMTTMTNIQYSDRLPSEFELELPELRDNRELGDGG
jgi:hypothetical protein